LKLLKFGLNERKESKAQSSKLKKLNETKTIKINSDKSISSQKQSIGE
jgi:hypothetical protein